MVGPEHGEAVLGKHASDRFARADNPVIGVRVECYVCVFRTKRINTGIYTAFEPRHLRSRGSAVQQHYTLVNLYPPPVKCGEIRMSRSRLTIN